MLLPAVAPDPQPDPAWGFGLGGAVFLLSLTALWASIHLRGRTNANLRPIVDLAFAGLQEQAVDVFQQLRTALDEILPAARGGFDPAMAIVDPGRVEKHAKRGIRILKQRQRMYSQFAALLVVCSCLKYCAFVFTFASLASTVLYFIAHSNMVLWQAFCITTCVVFGVGAVFFVFY
jgi:hypothetical protein